jgi:hypothetical protein
MIETRDFGFKKAAENAWALGEQPTHQPATLPPSTPAHYLP